MDKTREVLSNEYKKRKQVTDRKIINENDKTLAYFIKIWESLVEKHGVEEVYFASISIFAELANESNYPVCTLAERIAGNTGILCYKEARLQVLYSEKYRSESERVRNRLSDRKI